MRVKKNIEIKSGNKSFIKMSNNFYALYKNNIYVGNSLTLKQARGFLK